MSDFAIIGAGGFVGQRLTESLVLNGDRGPRAIVRSYRNLAGLCRFGRLIDIRFADAERSTDLGKALEGVNVVVNVTTGAPAGIERSTRTIYDACVRAKVSRLIHLSSAVGIRRRRQADGRRRPTCHDALDAVRTREGRVRNMASPADDDVVDRPSSFCALASCGAYGRHIPWASPDRSLKRTHSSSMPEKESSTAFTSTIWSRRSGQPVTHEAQGLASTMSGTVKPLRGGLSSKPWTPARLRCRPIGTGRR